MPTTLTSNLKEYPLACDCQKANPKDWDNVIDDTAMKLAAYTNLTLGLQGACVRLQIAAAIRCTRILIQASNEHRPKDAVSEEDMQELFKAEFDRTIPE